MLPPKRNKQVVEDYRWAHDRCACCGIPDHWTGVYRYPSGLQIAHICGGSSRFDIPANLLVLCARCHTDQHGGHCDDFDHRHLLVLKQELGELGQSGIDQLCEIAMRPRTYFEDHLSLEIPQRYLQERKRWRRGTSAKRPPPSLRPREPSPEPGTLLDE